MTETSEKRGAEVLSPAGVPLTAEEQRLICTRHPVNRRAVVTREGEILGAAWPDLSLIHI